MKVEFDPTDLEPLVRQVAAAVVQELRPVADPLKVDGKLALRPKDAAVAIGISERMLFELTKNGQVPHRRIGRAVVYPVDLLREWMNRTDQGDGCLTGEP